MDATEGLTPHAGAFVIVTAHEQAHLYEKANLVYKECVALKGADSSSRRNNGISSFYGNTH